MTDMNLVGAGCRQQRSSQRREFRHNGAPGGRWGYMGRWHRARSWQGPGRSHLDVRGAAAIHSSGPLAVGCGSLVVFARAGALVENEPVSGGHALVVSHIKQIVDARSAVGRG